MPVPNRPVRGVAAGVPFLAVPPTRRLDQPAPVVVAWHPMDPPRTEAAFAAALPLDGLEAWRIYLGLPLCGSRSPAGGDEELMRLGYEDAVMNLQGPIAVQGAEEFPAALGALRGQLDLGDGPLALVGGSMGSAVVLLVLTEADRADDIAAAVLVSPMAQLRPAVDATGRRYGMTYPWGPASLAVARRLDFVARVDEIVRHGQPAVRLIVGARDDPDGFLAPGQRLVAGLADRYDDPARADLVVVADMAHALAEEPGVEPAPQTAPAAAVDRHAVHWLRRHLGGTAAPGLGAAGEEP
ncbi:MAG: alpha/beta hydrolase [Acidimicrobiia bacterium]|nr:alpha/beta hydrolase [Acidimicrobiia bacterium]